MSLNRSNRTSQIIDARRLRRAARRNFFTAMPQKTDTLALCVPFPSPRSAALPSACCCLPSWPRSCCAASAAPPRLRCLAARRDPAAYLAQQFGPSFKLDPKVPPMFGDLDGDGNEDVVLVGTSSTPCCRSSSLASRLKTLRRLLRHRRPRIHLALHASLRRLCPRHPDCLRLASAAVQVQADGQVCPHQYAF